MHQKCLGSIWMVSLMQRVFYNLILNAAEGQSGGRLGQCEKRGSSAMRWQSQ